MKVELTPNPVKIYFQVQDSCNFPRKLLFSPHKHDKLTVLIDHFNKYLSKTQLHSCFDLINNESVQIILLPDALPRVREEF